MATTIGLLKFGNGQWLLGCDSMISGQTRSKAKCEKILITANGHVFGLAGAVSELEKQALKTAAESVDPAILIGQAAIDREIRKIAQSLVGGISLEIVVLLRTPTNYRPFHIGSANPRPQISLEDVNAFAIGSGSEYFLNVAEVDVPTSRDEAKKLLKQAMRAASSNDPHTGGSHWFVEATPTSVVTEAQKLT